MTVTETERHDGEFSYLRPTPQVAEAMARVIVAADERLGKRTDPRVLALANLPKAG